MMFPVKDGILYLDCPNVSVATVTTVTVKRGIEMENFMFSQKKKHYFKSFFSPVLS